MFQRLVKVFPIVALLLMPYFGFSQGIATFSSANPSNLVVCGTAQIFTLKISNTSLLDSIKSGKATVRLPVGFQYVGSSVSSSLSGVKESSISNLNQPVFLIPTISPKDSVKFSINVSVNCSVIAFINTGGSLRNFISLAYNGTAIDSGFTSFFSIGIPSLSISSFTNQVYSGTVGDTFSRQITIANTANAPLNSFTFYIIKGTGINVKSAAGKSFTTSHDTVFFTFNSSDFKNIGNKDGYLDQGEKIVLTETDSIISCNGLGNSYLMGWGCSGSLCQKYTTTSNVILSSKLPSLSVTSSSDQNECYVITSPNLQSVTITNNGNGPANNVLVDIMQTTDVNAGYNNGFNSKIDVSSIKIKYGSGSFTTITPDSTFANYLFSCLGTNPKGRFWIKIPVLKAGAEVTIEWNVYNCCISQGYLNSWGYAVSYSDQCGSTNYSTKGTGRSYLSNYQLFGDPVVNTHDLVASDTVSVYFQNNGIYSNLLPGTGKTYLQYQFFPGAGIKIDTSSIYQTDLSGTIIWKPDSIRLVGSIYHVSFSLPPPSGFVYYDSRIVMNMIGDTNTVSCNDSSNVYYNIYYQPNSSCGCKPLLASGVIRFKINCLNPDRVGMYNGKFSFFRTSYGLPDNNDDGFPDASGSLNFSKIRRDRAMFGDTLTANFAGRVITNSKYPKLKYAFADLKFTNDYLTHLDISLTIKDSTNKKTYTVTNVPYKKSGSDFYYYYGTDTLQWAGASVPSSYVYKKGDSIYITIHYRVTKNTQDVHYITLNDDFYFSTKPAPANLSDHLSLNKKPKYYYAVGYYFDACCSDDVTINGCSDVSFSENFYLSVGNCCSNYYGGDIFPYEYRYWGSFSEFKAVIPDNFKYESASIYYYPTEGQGKYGVYTGYPVASAISGDTVFFNLRSYYDPVHGYFPLSDDGYAGTMIVNCRPTCGAPLLTNSPVIYYEYFDQSAYLGGGISSPYSDVDYINYTPPAFNLQPALPTVSTHSDTMSWLLYITNQTLSSSANKTWLAFQNASGKLTVDTLLKGSKLVKDSNNIFHLDTVAAGKTYTIRIKALMKNCVKDSVKLTFGWDCNTYPDSLGSAKCHTQTMYLYADPLSPGLQLKSVNPPDSLFLCDTANYSVFISNTQSGSASGANFEINLPLGTSLVKGSSKLRFPMKGLLKTIADPDSINPFLLVYKSANLGNSLKANGLAGSYDTTKNEYQLNFKVVTNCDYISGSNLSYSAIANDACGNVVNTTGLQEHSLDIIGARSPYFASLSLNGQTSLSGCGGVSKLKLKFVNNGPVKTDTADFLFIDLPNGIRYVSKSLTKIHNSPSDSNLTVEALGTTTRYSWKIPKGVQSGDSIVYTINYTSDSSLSCGTFPVYLQSATTLSLYCISKHIYCNVKVLTGIAAKNFSLKKPSIGISGFSATALPAPPSGEKLTIKATISNSGDTLKASSKSVLKFYFDADGNGKYSAGDVLIGTDTINTIIKPNNTYSENKTLFVSAGKACGIIALWDTSGQNCACAPVQAYYGAIALYDAGHDTVLYSGAKIKLGTDSVSGYSYSWSPSTNLSNANVARPTFTFTNSGTGAIIQTYILTTIRKGCATKDSVKITVYPLMKASMSNSQTICAGTGNKIGGSPTVSGGSGTYTYTWTPATGLSSSTTANPIASPTVSTLYRVFVLDSTGGGGTITDSVMVNVIPNPTVKAGADITICEKDSSIIGGSPSASGTTGPYSYSWNPAAGLSTSGSANPKASPSSTTSYILFATDAKGCIGSDTMNLVVNPLPKINAGTNKTTCYGDSATLGGSPTSTGSTSPYSYRWSPVAGLSDTITANPRAAPVSNTTYTLKVVDGKGCVNRGKVTITLNPKINITTGANRRICIGNSTSLGGVPTASGGKSPYTYSWSPSSGLNSTAVANPNARPTSSTSYTLVVKDANNCSASASVTVFVNPLPTISAGPDDSLCKGDSVKISGTSAFAYKYVWIPGKYLSDSTKLTPNASPPSTTSYILKASDSIGCVSKDTMVVYVRPKTALSPPDLRCANVFDKNTVVLNWDPIPANTQFFYYTIYRKAGSGSYTKTAQFSNISLTSWTDTLATRSDSISYSYFVTVTNHCNFEGKGSDTLSSIVLTTTAVGDKSVIFNWNKFSTHNTTYTILYNSGSGYKTLATLKGTNYVNRSCNLNASYKIAVYDTGCSSNSYPSPTIKLLDNTPPPADSVIDVTTNSWGQIQVNFKQDDSTDSKTFNLYRSDSSGINYALVGKVNYVKGNTTYLFKDNGVAANHTRYLYKINITDSCGNVSGYSTAHSPVVLYGWPADYAVHVYWSKYIGFNVKNYIVQLLNSGTWADLSGQLLPTDTAYLDTLIPCNTVRYYRIKVTENGGNNAVSYSDSIPLMPFDTIHPLPAAITFVSVPTNGQVQVNWVKSTSNDVENYTIYRETGGIFKAIDSVGNVSSYTDKTANTLTSNCYEVVAVDSCARNRSKISAQHCDIALQVTNNGCEPANYLSWNAYSGWAGVSKYEIYRSVNGGASILLDSTTTATTYKDSGLSFHNNYCYLIKTYQSGGPDISLSNTFCKSVYFVDTPQVVVVTKLNTSTSAGQVKIKWISQKALPHLAFYRLYYSKNKAPYALLKDSIPIAQDSFIHTGLNTKIGDHYYYLQTMDSCGILSEISTVNKTMDFTFHVGQLTHQLNWTPYLGFPVKYYIVQHAINNNSLLDEDTLPGTDTTLHKFPAPCNTRIVYGVRAVSYAGVVSYSDSMGGQAIDTIPSNAPTLENASYVIGKVVKIDFLGSDSLDTYGYVLKRSENGGPFVTAGFINFSFPHGPAVFLDTVLKQTPLTYQVITEDSCLNLTNSQIFKTIYLSGNPENLSDSLKWTNFVGYGINKYVVLIYKNGAWQNLSNAKNDTAFFHDSLSCNVPRAYKIEGFGNGGFNTFSDSISVMPFDTTRPFAPVLNYATVTGPNSILLNWNFSLSKKVKDYEIDYKASTSSTWRVFKTVRLQNTITVTGLQTHDTAYDFRVIAIDTCAGNRSFSSNVHQTVLLKGTGGNLVSLLSWTPYQGFNVNRYIIFKFINNQWTRIDSVVGSSANYNDPDVICHGIYNYKILAYSNSGGFTSYSDSISVQPIDTVTPPTPTIQYASVIKNGSIAVFWNNSVPIVKQYDIWYRSAHGPWINDITLTNQYSTTISGLDTEDSTYSFRLNVIDSCSSKVSRFSSIHSVVHLDGTRGNLSNTINWTPYSGFSVKKYYIYIKNGAWQLLDSVSNTTRTYIHQPLPCNIPVNYRIGALDVTGKYLSFSDSIQLTPFDTIKPPPPVLFSATILPNSTVQVKWHWDKSSRINSFEIWRSVNGAAEVKIGSVTSDSVFIDKIVNPKTDKNAYYVIAIDSCSTLDRSVPSFTDTIMQIAVKTGGCNPFITINWTTYYTLNGSTDSFRIYKAENSGAFSYLSTVPASQLQYTDSLVDTSDHFSYKVEAFNHAQAYYSFTDSIGTTPWIFPRAKAPQLVYNTVVKTSPLNGIVHLRWNIYPFSKDTFAKGYNLYGSNSLNGPLRSLYHTTDKTATQFSVNGLNTSDSLNYFYLKVFNTCNLDGAPAKVNSPVKLTLQNKNLEIDLSWKPYQTTDSVKTYKIYRSVDHSGYSLYEIVSKNQQSFIDTNVYCEHLYYYRVSALTYNNTLPESFSDSAGVIAFDTIKPNPPKIYLVSTNSTASNNGTILITFKGNTKRTRAGYDVYYSTDGVLFAIGDSFKDFKTDTLVWQQGGLNTAGKPYSFYITAFDSCGNTSFISDTQTVVYLSAIAKDHRDSLHWTTYRGWKNWHYLLERKTQGTAWFPVTNLDSSFHSYVDHNTKCDTFYTYRIISIDNNNGLTSLSNEAGTTAFDTSAPIPPLINYVSVDITSKKHGRIIINWSRSKSTDVAFYDVYRQEDPSGPWTEIASKLHDTSFVDSILDTWRNTYRYRVEAGDSCSSPNTSKSIVHQSIALTAEPGDQRIDLSWNAYLGWAPTGYEIFRNAVPIGRVGGNVHSFVDSNVICPNFYFYIVAAINPSDTNIYAVSSIDSAKPYDNIAPAAPYLIRATISRPNNTVSLQWTRSRDVDVKGYRILRQEPGMNYFAVIDSVINPLDTEYTDVVNNIKDSLCYKVEAFDYCGNYSIKSNPGCVIIVQGQSKSLANVLRWNPYKEWPGGVSYYNLYRKTNDSIGYQLIDQFTNPQFIYTDTGFISDNKNFCYRIEAVENGGLQSNSWSTELCLVQQPLVWIPDAFTPDITVGINDQFGPKGLFMARYEMDIYNRWGQKVYYTNDSQPWDGNYQGKQVSEGVYLYYITIYAHDGVKYYFTGTVEIVK